MVLLPCEGTYDGYEELNESEEIEEEEVENENFRRKLHKSTCNNMPYSHVQYSTNSGRITKNILTGDTK